MNLRDVPTETRVKAFSDDMYMRVLLKFIFRDPLTSQAYRVSAIEIDEITEHDLIAPVYGDIALDHNAAQRLMDELWALGIRPSDVGSPGQLQATENHLEDMRKLSFCLVEHILSKE